MGNGACDGVMQLILDFKNEVKLLELIGAGAFGEVYRGIFKHEVVAVKMFGGMHHSAEAIATFEREAGLLSWYVPLPMAPARMNHGIGRRDHWCTHFL